ncbi:MAG: citrate/2-methylcitrate synthase [Spirochaetales bacterium]|nr:citrate/2-methylcitrate synthase [Spirochaetales bacterium]
MSIDGLIDQYIEKISSGFTISPESFERWNVKRGLRNNDGTGVVVGLTEIGDAHGYILDEGEKVPDAGRLRYRGIDVYDLVKGFQTEKRFGFEETVYLLLFGELPNQQQYDDFCTMMGTLRELPPRFVEDHLLITTPSKDIMNSLSKLILALYSYDETAEDYKISSTVKQCLTLIARFPLIVAYAYQAKRHYFNKESLVLHSPKPELSVAENFLHLLRPDSQYTELEAELLDLCLVLHAEHGGGNNSAFTVHVVTSSDTDTYSAISAGVGSLKGRRHGGANNKVMGMVSDLKANAGDWRNKEDVANYLRKILRKEANDGSGLIYGLGHAIYTVSDPRAEILKKKAYELAKLNDRLDEFELYKNIEELGPKLFCEEKGTDKVVCANVDLFSGFVYSMLGLESDLYTPLFAISRISGWSAHLIEEITCGGKIIRPAYKSVSKRQSYIPINQR